LADSVMIGEGFAFLKRHRRSNETASAIQRAHFVDHSFIGLLVMIRVLKDLIDFLAWKNHAQKMQNKQ